MRILIAGDLSLQNRAARCPWNKQQIEKAFAGVRQKVSECDYAVVNLESPITDSIKSILKDGPTLSNSSSALDIIKYCGFRAVTLANNHLKDYGHKGVLDTIRNCEGCGLEIVGAGRNALAARNCIVVKTKNLSVGIINVCEHESSIATRTSAGANPLDFPNLFDDITELRRKVDKVVVIVHGGREHFQLPTPRMKREYHLVADLGADVIVNHHQHCYSGYEIYKGKPIFYGLGNFFFDNPSKRNDKWNKGILLELNLSLDKSVFELIPFEQCNNEPVINIHKYKTIEDDIVKLNSVIADEVKLEDAFDKMVKYTKPLYPFLPYGNHYLRAFYNRGLLPDFITKENKAIIENAVSCETLREILLHYLNKNLHNED